MDRSLPSKAVMYNVGDTDEEIVVWVYLEDEKRKIVPTPIKLIIHPEAEFIIMNDSAGDPIKYIKEV